MVEQGYWKRSGLPFLDQLRQVPDLLIRWRFAILQINRTVPAGSKDLSTGPTRRLVHDELVDIGGSVRAESIALDEPVALVSGLLMFVQSGQPLPVLFEGAIGDLQGLGSDSRAQLK